jgi:hypothetical protein
MSTLLSDRGDVDMNATPEHPTTTHADAGQGNPRLVFVIGSDAWDGTPAREFPLVKKTTRIGSGSTMDLRLAGLEPFHAEIGHDDQDEYVLVSHGGARLSNDRDEGETLPGVVLRTGFRIELGEWAMFFSRDEFADHGRPFGGRQGGEGAHQQPQPPRDAD